MSNTRTAHSSELLRGKLAAVREHGDRQVAEIHKHVASSYMDEYKPLLHDGKQALDAAEEARRRMMPPKWSNELHPCFVFVFVFFRSYL